jgi:hypothetical protein
VNGPAAAASVAAGRRAVWVVYRWPGGGYRVTAWSLEPGAKEEHGPILRAGTIEDARAHMPAGLTRFDPSDEDRARSPAIEEIWL